MKSRLYIIPALLLMASCRGELPLMRAEGELVDDNPGSSKNIKGLYLLNEGNMGSNKKYKRGITSNRSCTLSCILSYRNY